MTACNTLSCSDMHAYHISKYLKSIRVIEHTNLRATRGSNHSCMCRVSSVLYIPIYSYIWKTVLYIPIYSYIWKTVLYIHIFRGKQEMLNSYLKQMLLFSNMERCKFVILQHLLSNSHSFRCGKPSHYRFAFFPGMNLGKLTYKSTGESILFVKLFCFIIVYL